MMTKQASKHVTDMSDMLADAKQIIANMLAHPKAQQELTMQEAEFVSAYILTESPKQAGLKAGYAPSTAASNCWKWVTADLSVNRKPWVFAAIHASTATVKEKTAKLVAKSTTIVAKQRAAEISDSISPDYVLNNSVEMIEVAMGRKPDRISEEIDPETGEIIPKEHFKKDYKTALKANEQLGKHKDVRAFDNKVEVTVDDELSELLANLEPSMGPPSLLNEKGLIIEADIIAPSDTLEADMSEDVSQSRGLLPSK